MVRRSGKSAQGRNISDGLILMAILFLCFLGAGVAGCLAVAGAGEGGVSSLSSYLHNYCRLVSGDAAVLPSVWSVAWELCRWPLLTFLLGFTALGAVAVPAVFCVRGFLLAYSVASFVRVFGPVGVLAAFAVFGMTALAAVPALFCVGLLSFQTSLRLAAGVLGGRQGGVISKERLIGLAPCAGMLVLAVFLQWSVMPQLLSAISGALLGIQV